MTARILAVEDTSSLRDLLELCLKRAGYTVQLAEDGRAAMDLFETGPPDAVVMDIQMPVMDGLSAAARMRAWEKRHGRAPVPIIALTANTEPADFRRCLEAGFTTTVRKPFSREDLLAAVAAALGAEPAPIVVQADPAFAELIPRFLENCREDTVTMRSALERGDFAAIAVGSHKLLGSGASYGFHPLSDASRDLEAAAKSRDAAGVAAHLETMSLYLKRVSVVYP